jgi:GNAT superfamily N-acetyltransferase
MEGRIHLKKSMFTIRRYQKNDAEQVGILIAETYGAFNLPEMTPEKREAMLGPFAFARSSTLEHREAIAEAIEAPSVWVAEQDGEIVGVLRGGRVDHRWRTVLSSLFVSRKYHRQGVGRSLVEQFEAEYVTQGVTVFKLSATLYAVPFYLSVGYKRSTGVRSMHSFDEGGLLYQPMKKVVM